MSAALFSPFALRGLTLPNRIVISPMCQYSAVDGCATDWHTIHLGHLAFSGAGLLILEATGVCPDARISRECLGLYSDDCEAALGRVLDVVRRYANMPIGIQLGHAGRKGSQKKPTDGRGSIAAGAGDWQTVAPSALPFIPEWQTPVALDRAGMLGVTASFVDATRRAARLGLDLIELHFAHGYLMSSFLSPLANRRDDEYGGSLDNRMRYPLEVFAAVRAAWPDERPLGVRCNGTDWDESGITPAEAVAFSRRLKALGCDYVDASSGGNGMTRIPLEPGYQVPFAQRIRAQAGIATMAVGLIRDPAHAEAIGAQAAYPYQYFRAVTREGVAQHFAKP